MFTTASPVNPISIINPRMVASGALARIWHRPPTSRPGPVNPVYCYGVAMRHLALAQAGGMPGIPRVVAELGAGRSLGAGLVFLLAGAEKLIALDERDFLERDRLLPMFDGLVELFRAGAVPDTASNWPGFAFTRLPLSPRVDELREDLEQFVATGRSRFIIYRAPWSAENLPPVDLLFSHAVLQQLRDLEGSWRTIATMLAPGGFSTHQFDMTSLSLSKVWNGHWAYPEWLWNIVLAPSKGLYLNRATFTRHVDAVKAAGLDVDAQSQQRSDGLLRGQFVAPWDQMGELDSRTYSGFIVAKR